MKNEIYTNAYLQQLTEDCRSGKRKLEMDERYAFWAYGNTRSNKASEYIVDDLGFPRDVPGFMRTMDRAGITEFILADRSTALMEMLNVLLNGGWQIAGTWEKPNKFDFERKEYGLRMRKAA